MLISDMWLKPTSPEVCGKSELKPILVALLTKLACMNLQMKKLLTSIELSWLNLILMKFANKRDKEIFGVHKSHSCNKKRPETIIC